MSIDWDAYIPSDPLGAARWSRLVAHYLDQHPEEDGLGPLFEATEGPTLPVLLEALAGDLEALAEDEALQAWDDVDVDETEEAQPHWMKARELSPGHPEVRILDAVLTQSPEARLPVLEALAEELREGLDEDALAALAAGRGHENIPALRLHRCLREWASTLLDLDRPADLIPVAETLFEEAGADPFGLFPLFVHACLQVGDLEALDTWTPKMGQDTPALTHWLQTFLHHANDQPGAAFQSLRRARKVTSGVEVALGKWEQALPDLAQLPEGSEPPDLPLPSDPASAMVVQMLGPDLAGTPAFMAWLRKMRTMK